MGGNGCTRFPTADVLLTWTAQSPRDVRQWAEDLNNLADAIIDVAEICNQRGSLVWVNATDDVVPFAGPALRTIIEKSIVIPQLVNSKSQFVPFTPGDGIIKTLLIAEDRNEGSLIARAPKLNPP